LTPKVLAEGQTYRSGGWVKKISLDNNEGQWIADSCRQSKKAMANCYASKVGGNLEFDSWPWCSRHAEEFCNQGTCAAPVNENFGLFLLQQMDKKLT
jgi:hypothetical protein